MKFDKKKIVFGSQVFLSDDDKMPERKIEVVFATDDNYSKHCAAAIVSILLNSDKSSSFRFHILDGGIKDDTKNRINELEKLRDFEIQYYNMKSYDFSYFPLNRDYISVATYYRLFLLDVLPEDIKKVIYLDCDIIVEKDLKDLWDIDINEYLAGVVEDEGSIEQLTRLKLPIENNYFNAGVAVFNIEKLRNTNFKHDCIDYYIENQDIIVLQDQDILNGVLNGKCKYLPLNWNANGRIYVGSNLRTKYTKDDAIKAGYNPSILHYSDIHKPWMESCRHPLWAEYWKYLGYTPFECDLKKHIAKRKIYLIKSIIKSIFSIRNIFSMQNEYSFDKSKKHKIVRICYFKFKIKCAPKKEKV